MTTVALIQHMKVGRRASFVRWTLTADGWKSEIADGVFVGCLPDRFVIRTDDGSEHLLDRADWLPVVA